jgi:hypothetical protein
VPDLAPAGCRRTYHKHAVSHGICDAWKLSRIEKDSRRPNSRPCLTKRGFERFHDAQVREAEVADGPRCRADIHRIARVDQNDGETVVSAISFQVAIIVRFSQTLIPVSLLERREASPLDQENEGLESKNPTVCALNEGVTVEQMGS